MASLLFVSHDDPSLIIIQLIVLHLITYLARELIKYPSFSTLTQPSSIQ